MDLTKKSALDTVSRSFTFSSLRMLTNDKYKKSMWVMDEKNDLLNPNRIPIQNTLVLRIRDNKGNAMNGTTTRYLIRKLFNLEQDQARLNFAFTEGDVISKINIEGYFALAELFKANGLKANIKKGTIEGEVIFPF